MSMEQSVYVVNALGQAAVGIRVLKTDDVVVVGGRSCVVTRTASGGDVTFSYAPQDGGAAFRRDNLHPGEAYILKAAALAFTDPWPSSANGDKDFRAAYAPISGTETQRKFTVSTGNTQTTSSY